LHEVPEIRLVIDHDDVCSAHVRTMPTRHN
jgi:hypothetical protein